MQKFRGFCDPQNFLPVKISDNEVAELFNKFVKESCFPDCWKALLVVPEFKNIYWGKVYS